MNEALRSGLLRLAADGESGASELLPRAIDLLRTARQQGPDTLADVARGVVVAQPGMASLWNAAAAALADTASPGTMELFAERASRARAALRRVAVETLATRDWVHGVDTRRGDVDLSLHLTTCSFSGSVLAALTGVSATSPLTVACAEGRPRFEGRRLARALAEAGVRVEFFSDAALATALPRTQAVVVGADAVAPGWFLNKTGTSQLAAAASVLGVPVFVLATRDKFVPAALADHLRVIRAQRFRTLGSAAGAHFRPQPLLRAHAARPRDRHRYRRRRARHRHGGGGVPRRRPPAHGGNC